MTYKKTLFLTSSGDYGKETSDGNFLYTYAVDKKLIEDFKNGEVCICIEPSDYPENLIDGEMFVFSNDIEISENEKINFKEAYDLDLIQTIENIDILNSDYMLMVVMF